MGSDAAGFEEAGGDVVGKVAEVEGGASEVFEASVDGSGGAVARSRVVKVREDVLGAAVQGSSESADLDQGGGGTAADSGDQCVHGLFRVGAVRAWYTAQVTSTSVCSTRVKVVARRVFCVSVSRSWPVSRVRRARYKGSTRRPRCPRVAWRTRRRVSSRASAASLTTGGYLPLAGEEGVQHGHRGRQLLGDGGLVAGEAAHGDDLDVLAPRPGWVDERSR